MFLFVKSGGHKILEMYERVKRIVFFSETILGVTNKIVYIKEIRQSSTNNFFNYFLIHAPFLNVQILFKFCMYELK